MIIIESGMTFGEYSDKQIYYIEQDDKYKQIREKGISSVEFILCNQDENKLLFVEAKSSAPNPQNDSVKFKEFIDSINKKFIDSLGIYERVVFEGGIKGAFENIDYNTCRIIFMLVINNFEKEWLAPIRDALNIDLIDEKLVYSLWRPTVLVLNNEQAKSKGYVI